MNITHKVGAFVAALFLVAAFSAQALQASSYPTEYYNSQRVFVVTQGVTLRSGPGTRFDAIGTLKQGQRIPVTGIVEGYLRIPLQNGQDGYAWFEYLHEEGAETTTASTENTTTPIENNVTPTPSATPTQTTQAPLNTVQTEITETPAAPTMATPETTPESEVNQAGVSPVVVPTVTSQAAPTTPASTDAVVAAPAVPAEPAVPATPTVAEPPHPDMSWEHQLTARVMADERLYEPLSAIRSALKFKQESLGAQQGVLIVGGAPFFESNGKSILFVYTEKGGDYMPLIRSQGTNLRALTHSTNNWRDIEVIDGTKDAGDSIVYTFTDNGYKPTRCFSYTTQNNNRVYQTKSCPQ